MYPFQRAPRYNHNHQSDIVNNLVVHVEYEPYERYYDISGTCHCGRRRSRSRSRSRSPRSPR